MAYVIFDNAVTRDFYALRTTRLKLLAANIGGYAGEL